MALFHLHLKNISRADGKFAVAAAAYRAGERLWNAAEGKYTDFANRRDVVHSEVMAPESAPAWARDRAELWNRVEAAERRKDARLAKEVECALPVELPRAEQINLARRFAAGLVELGLVVDLAVHDKGEGNPHVHLQLTTRTLTETRFGSKLRNLDSKAFLTRLRKEWAKLANAAYGAAGLDARIDHRSLKAQGIDRVPQKHRGPEKPGRARRRDRERRPVDERPQAARETSIIVRTDAPSSREERMSLSVYDELNLIQNKLDEVEKRRPADIEALKARDDYMIELNARRDALVGLVKREELEQGRDMDEGVQRKLLDLWDEKNRPVPDQDGRPVNPADARYERDDHRREKEQGSELDWKSLSPGQKREMIERRTRLDELGAEITEVKQQLDKIERARFMSAETKLARRTELMHRQNDLQKEEDRIALKELPRPERPATYDERLPEMARQLNTTFREIIERDPMNDRGDERDIDDRSGLDDMRKPGM